LLGDLGGGLNSLSERNSLGPAPCKSDIEQMRDHLNKEYGIKSKELAQGNVVRLYNEMKEYEMSGKLPDYLI
jgi:hypothetical protein